MLSTSERTYSGLEENGLLVSETLVRAWKEGKRSATLEEAWQEVAGFAETAMKAVGPLPEQASVPPIALGGSPSVSSEWSSKSCSTDMCRYRAGEGGSGPARNVLHRHLRSAVVLDGSVVTEGRRRPGF